MFHYFLFYTLTAVSAFAQFIETKLPSKLVTVDYCLGFGQEKVTTTIITMRTILL